MREYAHCTPTRVTIHSVPLCLFTPSPPPPPSSLSLALSLRHILIPASPLALARAHRVTFIAWITFSSNITALFLQKNWFHRRHVHGFKCRDSRYERHVPRGDSFARFANSSGLVNRMAMEISMRAISRALASAASVLPLVTLFLIHSYTQNKMGQVLIYMVTFTPGTESSVTEVVTHGLYVFAIVILVTGRIICSYVCLASRFTLIRRSG